MVPFDRLRQITERFEYLEALLASGGDGVDIAAVSKEYSDLKPVATEISDYQRLLDDLEGAEAMLDDPEMRELAREEIAELQERKPELEHKLRLALLPKDAADERAAIIEIRPGTGGDEASLFAGDLLRMYQRYAEARGWKFEILEQNETAPEIVEYLLRFRHCHPTWFCLSF